MLKYSDKFGSISNEPIAPRASRVRLYTTLPSATANQKIGTPIVKCDVIHS